MIQPGSYANGFAPRDGRPLYPELWRGIVSALDPTLGHTGLTLRDWSGQTRNATLTATTNAAALSMWGLNGGSSSIECVSVDNSIVNLNTTLPETAGAPAVTIACWMRRKTSGSQLHVGCGVPSTSYAGLLLNHDNNVYFMSQPNFPSVANTSTSWQHIAMTLRASTITGYINGNTVVSGAGPAVFPTFAVSWSLGIYHFGNQYNNGYIKDFRVYRRALVPGEIALLSRRPGIAYELATRRRSSSAVAGFRPYWIPRRQLIIGGGL